MLHYIIRSSYRIAAFALPLVALVALSGCGGAAGAETVTLELPDGTIVEVGPGSGAASLTNTSWRLIDANTGAALVTINFGAVGNLESFTENHIVEEMLGSTILFDGMTHETSIPLIQYTASTVGAGSGGAFVFQASISAAAPIVGEVASGTADADGEIDSTDPNAMTGTLSFDFELSSLASNFVSVPADSLNGEFEFTATKIE